MNRPVFSIITTTYNRVASGYLEECIKSVRSQKGGEYDYEHIIVDDGSIDETRSYVEGLAQTDKKIKYHYQDNTGPAKATQTGIRYAKGDYIIIIDDDDALTQDSLHLRAKYIKNNPDIDWFYGFAEWVDEYGLPTNELFRSRPQDDYHYERLLVSNYINAGTPTIRRKCLDGITWPEWLNRSQDYFLWLELLRPERGYKNGFLPASLVKYRYHSTGYTSLLNTEEKKKEKAELNFRIKSLHSKDLAFLAEEAYRWTEEAHKAANYGRLQLKSREQRINQLQGALDGYEHSRFIQAAVKIRNKLRGLERRSYRLFSRAKNLLTRSIPSGAINVTVIENKPWAHDQPLVSVITPYYNRQDTMPETVRSVLSQTLQDFEYIVVDDGSPALEAQQYLTKLKHPKITVIRQENQGVAAARNNGIAHARGKYVVCLDSDDMLDSTYLEKSVLVLEANPDVSLVTYDMQMFGEKDDLFRYPTFKPTAMLEDNYIITAALFRRQAWQETEGYKKEIGYEDWEFWVNLIEHGAAVKHIPETLFKYRTARNSRYVDDLMGHNVNTDTIKKLHPHFKKNVAKHRKDATKKVTIASPKSTFVNYLRDGVVRPTNDGKTNILLAIPWMTFGGAETLIYNFCREVKDDCSLTFVTGLKSNNEWEYKFKEITSNIYHLPNLFDDKMQYLEFISRYIQSREIDILHIIHTDFIFDMLPELKQRHPGVKVIVTMFNDRVDAYVQGVNRYSSLIDIFSTDNDATAKSFKGKINPNTLVKVIPNGIDCYREFTPMLFDRDVDRAQLNIRQNDTAIFFVGRLSEEKNPDIFIRAASAILKKQPDSHVKFFIIGDGTMRVRIEKMISDINSDNITYLGYRSDVAKYYNAADIFVLPSSIEGFPLSILEAMAMETAVIASDVGAVSEVINNSKEGYVVKPGDASEIAEKILLLNTDRKLLNSIKQVSRKKVKATYSSTELGNNYKRLYSRHS